MCAADQYVCIQACIVSPLILTLSYHDWKTHGKSTSPHRHVHQSTDILFRMTHNLVLEHESSSAGLDVENQNGVLLPII